MAVNELPNADANSDRCYYAGDALNSNVCCCCDVLKRLFPQLNPMPRQITANSAAVATGHPLGAAAGLEILQDGGNAIDSAVAAMLAMCVVVPGSVGLGGYGGSAVIHLARTGKTVAVDFDSRAPLAFRDGMVTADRESNYYGARSVTVPAVVAGLDLILREYGSKSWQTASQPAIRLGRRRVRIRRRASAALRAMCAQVRSSSRSTVCLKAARRRMSAASGGSRIWRNCCAGWRMMGRTRSTMATLPSRLFGISAIAEAYSLSRIFVRIGLRSMCRSSRTVASLRCTRRRRLRVG